MRINGSLSPFPNRPVISPEEAQQLIVQLLTDQQRSRLAQDFVVDFSMSMDQTRYRGNVLFQRNGLEAVLRLIPLQIPGPEELMFPPILTELTNLKGGLILVTGPTGGGEIHHACLPDRSH